MPGDRIPSERELSRTLGVGRSSVRDALKPLTLLGIIDVRQGDGTYLRATESELLPKAIEWGLLLGEQSGGYQHHYLPAGLYGRERGPHRDLGLAEAHVAADDAVHRLGAGQILEYLADGIGLVFGFLERKCAGERAVFALL